MTLRPLALRAGQSPPSWYRVGPALALADPPGESDDEPRSSADVYVFERIGGWFGMTADDFVRDVAGLDVDQLVIHLNSPGGEAMEGVAIANVLRAHRARVVVRVDGMAASAASVIAMAGDEVVMGVGSQMMIHDAWSLSMGNADELRKDAAALDSVSDGLASTYAAKAGGTREEWRAVMRAESWYAAEEAVAAGLADRVADADETGTAEGEQVTPGSSLGFWDMWDELRSPERHAEALAAFRYPGRAHAPAPAMPGRETPAESVGGSDEQGRSRAVAFSDEQLTDMRKQLGVADDADEATILAALTEALAEQAEPPSAALPPGVVTVEKATLDELRAKAARGDEARARQEREDRERLVEAAVADGRIAPARREHWVAALAADPGAAATLAGLEKGLVPVGAELGHAASTSDPEADALYASVFGKE